MRKYLLLTLLTIASGAAFASDTESKVDTLIAVDRVQITAIKQGSELRREAVAASVLGGRTLEMRGVSAVKEIGMLRLDRILYTATHYPANYGFIPRTYADDGDPLDVLVLCSDQIVPMTLVQVYPIGAMRMIDGGKLDDKIIAIPFSDPTYKDVRSINELPPHIFAEIKHFFTVYKELENKQTAVKDLFDRNDAIEIIRQAIVDYDELVKNKNS